MSGGGGSTTTVQKSELPSWLQDAAKQNLAKADYVSKLGYVPQYGLDVAGFSPMQEAAMQNTANAASAFGLQAPTNAMAGMPQQQTNNLGFSGYSSGSLFDQALAQLAANRPAQFGAMQGQFIDPITGDLPVNFGAGGSISVDDSAQMSIPVAMGDGGSGISYQNSASYDPSKMSLATEDFLLGTTLATQDYPVMAPAGIFAKGINAITGPMIDARLDALASQWNNVGGAQSGVNVVSDANGNLYTTSPSTWSNGSGSSFNSSNQWDGNDFSDAGWTSTGNDWDNF